MIYLREDLFLSFVFCRSFIMNIGHVEYQIYKLSKSFFDQYADKKDSEILLKQDRPYNCLLIDTKCGYLICIPYRTEIRHKEAYLFRGTKRSQNHKSGLDYSKMIILEDLSYIDPDPALVDPDEFTETRKNINKIAKQANAYLDTYMDHCNGQKVLPKATFERKYKYSTLKNFHDILGIK